jgi:hypothetical protein
MGAGSDLSWGWCPAWGAIEQNFLRSLRAELRLVGVGRDTRVLGAEAPVVGVGM